MSRFEAMAVFIAVGEGGSFTRAAARLGKPVSTVSRAVSSLEAKLGVQLLVRNTRRVVLTDHGREYLSHCRRILTDVEEAEAALSRDARSLSGIVRLTAPTVFGSRFAASLAAQFVQRHPGLQTELTLTDRLVDLIGEGLDLAIRTAALEDSELVVRKMGGFHRIMCCAPAYLDRTSPIDSLDDLRRASCLVFTRLKPRAEWVLTDASGRLESVPVAGCISADNTNALYQAALEGAGVILTPTWQARTDLLSGRLVAVLPEFHTPEVPVSVLFPRTRLLSARVRAMVEAVASALPAFLDAEGA